MRLISIDVRITQYLIYDIFLLSIQYKKSGTNIYTGSMQFFIKERISRANNLAPEDFALHPTQFNIPIQLVPQPIQTAPQPIQPAQHPVQFIHEIKPVQPMPNLIPRPIQHTTQPIYHSIPQVIVMQPMQLDEPTKANQAPDNKANINRGDRTFDDPLDFLYRMTNAAGCLKPVRIVHMFEGVLKFHSVYEQNFVESVARYNSNYLNAFIINYKKEDNNNYGVSSAECVYLLRIVNK